MRILHTILFVFLVTPLLLGQSVSLDRASLTPSQAFLSIEKIMGHTAVKVVKDSTVKDSDAPTFVKLNGTNFSNGTIEVMVLSRLQKNAPAFARGFIGVAFRINSDQSKFECIYLRPTNARVDDQLRRNHSIQYFSFPDYDFDRLRQEAPGVYESYADMDLNQWIKMKIVVNGAQTKLYLNDQAQPSLVVNDLKHGADASGSVALWVDTGTEGFFRDVKIEKGAHPPDTK